MNPECIEEVLPFPYKLDGFQIDAIDAILKGHNVLTLSHTGSGKSTIGEFSIAGRASATSKSIIEKKENKYLLGLTLDQL